MQEEALKKFDIIVLGPQASPPARVQLSPRWQFTWLFSTRAGGDACGPSTTIVLFRQS